ALHRSRTRASDRRVLPPVAMNLREVRRFLRRALARLAAIAIGVRRRDHPVIPSKIRSVLVIRVDERVGNVLLTTPLLVRLQEALPSARIDVLVAASKRALVVGLA